MSYPRFESMTAPARAKSEYWRTAVGLFCAIALYMAGSFAFFGIVQTLFGAGIINEIADGNTPRGMLLLLAHFAVMAGSVALTVIYLHGRGPLTLLGDRSRLWRDFLSMVQIALIIALILGAFVAFIWDLDGNVSFGTWLVLLPLALPLVALQTGAEEVVFRGYLQQQLGARTGLRAVWIGLPSVAFTFVHVDTQTMGQNMWLYLAVIFLFALITADITARTGSIGAAWGLHFMNNVQAILVFSFTGPLSGLGLISLGLPISDAAVRPLLFLQAMSLVLLYVLWRRRHG